MVKIGRLPYEYSMVYVPVPDHRVWYGSSMAVVFLEHPARIATKREAERSPIYQKKFVWFSCILREWRTLIACASNLYHFFWTTGFISLWIASIVLIVKCAMGKETWLMYLIRKSWLWCHCDLSCSECIWIMLIQAVVKRVQVDDISEVVLVVELRWNVTSTESCQRRKKKRMEENYRLIFI